MRSAGVHHPPSTTGEHLYAGRTYFALTYIKNSPALKYVRSAHGKESKGPGTFPDRGRESCPRFRIQNRWPTPRPTINGSKSTSNDPPARPLPSNVVSRYWTLALNSHCSWPIGTSRPTIIPTARSSSSSTLTDAPPRPILTPTSL